MKIRVFWRSIVHICWRSVSDWCYIVAWMVIGMIGSFLFILIQLVLIVDFAHVWNEKWVSKYEDTQSKAWMAGMLAFTTVGVVSIYTGSMEYPAQQRFNCGLHAVATTVVGIQQPHLACGALARKCQCKRRAAAECWAAVWPRALPYYQNMHKHSFTVPEIFVC